MKKTICDRCGEHFTEYPWQAVKFPVIDVYITDNLAGPFFRKIDLCRECKDALLKWIAGEERKDKEGGDGDA